MDKPTGMTSQDVVNVVRRTAGTKRVGHTGTLDPLATGVLVVLLGEATKLCEYLVGFDKEYEGTMRLGVSSDTYDIEGTLTGNEGAGIPTLETLRRHLAPLVGDIFQRPPAYSAVKVGGKKLYEYARKGEVVEAEARAVTVHAFEVLSIDGREATFRVSCTSGTYVRSLVHELGAAAGCGAVVSSLRRTRVGDIAIDEAVELPTLEAAAATAEGIVPHLLPMIDAMTAWPIYRVNVATSTWVRRGQAVPAALGKLEEDCTAARFGQLAFICAEDSDAIAVAKMVPVPPSKPPAELRAHAGGWLQPVKLLAPESTG